MASVTNHHGAPAWIVLAEIPEAPAVLAAEIVHPRVPAGILQPVTVLAAFWTLAMGAKRKKLLSSWIHVLSNQRFGLRFLK